MKFKEWVGALFRDSNDINEKAVIGFLAFFMMVIFAIADIITGYLGKDLVINDFIFNAFLWLTLGSFGIASVDKFINKKAAQEEKAEGEVIAKYLPAQLSEDDVKKLIAAAIASTGAAGPADMGKVMGAIKPQIAGKADGSMVSSLVKAALAGGN